MRPLAAFTTPDSRRLALLFAGVYFSQAMFGLPDQALTIGFKERGLDADEVALFFLVASIPWFIKPVYGLVSDFVPLFGRRRTSYLLLGCALAAAMALGATLADGASFWQLAALYAAMGLGFAVADVMTDALMVERGKPLGLTGAFQSVQWAAITGASIVVGMLGGYFAEQRNVAGAFAVVALLPLAVFVLAAVSVREAPAPPRREAARAAWAAVRDGVRHRTMWLVAGFTFLFYFSPSLGPAFLYYQTDVLGFGQQFIGTLASVNAAASVLGALLYLPLSRRLPLQRTIPLAVVLSVAATLAYLLYRDATSAVVIQVAWGIVSMVTLLAFLDLAARACPQGAEATFFALLMSVSNLGTQTSQNVGAWLYTAFGEGSDAYISLVFISAVATAAVGLLIPWLRIGRIEAAARGEPPPAAAP